MHQSLRSIAVVAASAFCSLAELSFAAPTLPLTTPAVVEPSGPSRAAPVNVLITPFRAIGETGKDAWISDAINEQITSDLSRNAAIHVLHGPTTMPTGDILDLARKQHADRLVTGSFQTIDDQIRVDGDVIDPSDGKTVAQLKVTGPKRDLFRLEDSLVAELQHAMPGVEQSNSPYTVTPIASDGMNQPDTVAQADPAGSPQVVNNYYYDNGSGYGNSAGYYSGYGDGYGGYGDYGYPYYGSPFFFYIGGDRFHHFHNGDFHGDGSGGRDRLVGGGPILSGPSGPRGGFGPAVVGPAHGSVGGRGPVGGGAMGGGLHGGGSGGAGGHR